MWVLIEIDLWAAIQSGIGFKIYYISSTHYILLICIRYSFF